MFYLGIEQMIANGEKQSTFREFVDKYAPSFQGRAKCVFDDIALRVEERLGYIVQTRTINQNRIKFEGECGFRLAKLS